MKDFPSSFSRRAVRRFKTDLAPELLCTFLTDQRIGYGRYPKESKVVEVDNEKAEYILMRVCDNVYELISWAIGNKSDHCSGTSLEMDKRIEILLTHPTVKKALSSKN